MINYIINIINIFIVVSEINNNLPSPATQWIAIHGFLLSLSSFLNTFLTNSFHCLTISAGGGSPI